MTALAGRATDHYNTCLEVQVVKAGSKCFYGGPVLQPLKAGARAPTANPSAVDALDPHELIVGGLVN